MIITRTFDSSSSDAVYTAKLDTATGDSLCSCPGWRFKKGAGPRTCKHTRLLASERTPDAAIDATPPAPRSAARAEVKPMLASAMTRATLTDYCTDAWRLEEKFDGHRVLVRKAGADVHAWSRPRAGKDALPRELPAAIVAAVRSLPDGLYDGELLLAGAHAWDVVRLETRADLVLMLFDVIEVFGQSIARQPYVERCAVLRLAVEHYTRQDAGGRIQIPQSQPVSRAAVDAIWNRGGEGAILKRAASTYQPGKRSPDWIKVKRSGSAVLTIIGFEQGKCGPYAVTQLRADDGRETTVKTKDNATMAAIAANPASFIGRRLVIAYHELTPDGSFRHGTWDHLAGERE